VTDTFEPEESLVMTSLERKSSLKSDTTDTKLF
jgi:hypothetical protein